MSDKIEEIKINNSKFEIKDITEPKSTKEEGKNENKEGNDNNNDKPETPEIDYSEEDNVEDRRKRLMIIARYKNSKRFGSWLKTQGFDFNLKSLKDKSNEELDTMINDIRFCISTKNTNNMYETAATKGVLIIENLLRPIYKVDGLSEVLTKDPMYLDLVEELMLERSDYIYVKPEYRLLYCVISSAYIVHNHHIMLQKLSETEEGKQMIKDLASKINENESKNKDVKSDPQILSRIVVGSNQVPTKQLDDKFIEKFKDLMDL
jgi:hypothetical protein